MLFETFSTLVSLALLARVSTSPTPSTDHLEKRVAQVSFSQGGLNVYATGSPIVTLSNGVDFYYQNTDSNFVAYQNSVAVWQAGIHKPAGCAAPNVCELVFQDDGNFVSYYNGAYNWNSGTAGGGWTLVFYDVSPWIVIYDLTGGPIWDATQGRIVNDRG